MLVAYLQIEEALAAVSGVRHRQRLRNAAVLLFTDWREVWSQVSCYISCQSFKHI
jgi:hypothetical protein